MQKCYTGKINNDTDILIVQNSIESARTKVSYFCCCWRWYKHAYALVIPCQNAFAWYFSCTRLHIPKIPYGAYSNHRGLDIVVCVRILYQSHTWLWCNFSRFYVVKIRKSNGNYMKKDRLSTLKWVLFQWKNI